MTNALGPVLGNRFDTTGTAAMKPHLQQRLAAQVQRTTPEGTFTTAPDGRMEFVPDRAAMEAKAAQAVLTHNQQVLQRIQALKSAPTPEMREKQAAEEAHARRQEFIDSTRSRVRNALYGEPMGALGHALQRVHEQAAQNAPAEGDDEREAMGLVDIKCRSGMGISQQVMTPLDAFATLAMTPAELQQVMGFPVVNGSPPCAGHARPMDTFGVGDTVLRTSGKYAGLTGTVMSLNSHSQPFVSFSSVGVGMACDPAFLRLVKKAGA